MRALALTLILWLAPMAATAQMAATLLADFVQVTADGTLNAQGNVEVFFDGTRLSAARITYNQATDRLIIEGPIFVQSPDGTIITADSANLDPRLQNGILIGARLVLDRQLQLAANQIDRAEGRYTQLYKAAVTSCHVCDGRPPLWQIRAQRVVHDQQEQQLYFDNATLMIRDVPIFWVPRMRLPDPTLHRASGFLVPNIRSSNRLGTGIKMPYFIRMGDHRDLTLTPYVSSKTTTLEALYRQAFINGDLNFRAAVSQDNNAPDETRWYLFGDATFDLSPDYQLNMDVEMSSDPSYLLDYGYSNKDRLDSEISISRVDEDQLVWASITHYNSLRDDEDNDTLPTVLTELSWEKLYNPLFIGGVLRLDASADAHFRTSNTDGDDGRDMARIGVGAQWNRNWVFGPGMILEGVAGVAADHFTVEQDVAYANNIGRVVPVAALTLRWPLAMTTRTGTQHLIEPMVQFAWSDIYGDAVSNEDSTRVEFDEASLYSTNRFTAHDAAETGIRANVGLTWTRIGTRGGQSTLTMGRVLRQTTSGGDFTPSSGLAGMSSDWLVAGQIYLPNGLGLKGRVLWDDTFEPTKSELQLSWHNDRFDLAAGYLFQEADLAEDRPDVVSEWEIDGRYQINDMWSFATDTRIDATTWTPAHAGIGIGYSNECVNIDLSVSRRFTSSATVKPSTDFGLSVELSGFSAGRSATATQAQCRG